MGTRWIVAGLVVVAGVLAAAGSVFTQNSLFVPRKQMVASGMPVELTARDGSTLRASWFPSPSSRRCVLVLHGISDSRASSSGFAQIFVNAGYSALAPDSRAHGESGGEMVTYGLLEKYDTIGWAHWLQTQGCSHVFGLGESLGGSVLLQAAALEPVFSALVTESAYADIQDAAEARLMHMIPGPRFVRVPLASLVATNGRLYARGVYGLDLASASPLEAMRTLRTPVLLVHGAADDQTPPEHSQRLAAMNPEFTELWIVPGVRHASAYSADPGEYVKRVVGWFDRH